MLKSAKNQNRDIVQKILKRHMNSKEGNCLRKQNHMQLHQHPYLSVQRKLQSIYESMEISSTSIKRNINFVTNHFEKMTIFDSKSQEFKMIEDIIDFGIQMSLIKELNSNSNSCQRNDQNIDHSQISDYHKEKSEISETSTTCGRIKNKLPIRDSEQLSQEESLKNLCSPSKNSRAQNQCQKGTPKFKPGNFIQNQDEDDENENLSQYWQYFSAPSKIVSNSDFHLKVCKGLQISRKNNDFSINNYNEREITLRQDEYSSDIDQDDFLSDNFVYEMDKPLYDFDVFDGLKPYQRQQLFLHLIEKEQMKFNLDKKDKPIPTWAESASMGHDFNKGKVPNDVFKKVHIRKLHFGIMNGRDIQAELGKIDKMRVQAENQQYRQKQKDKFQILPGKEKEADETKRITFFKKSSGNKKQISS